MQHSVSEKNKGSEPRERANVTDLARTNDSGAQEKSHSAQGEVVKRESVTGAAQIEK